MSKAVQLGRFRPKLQITWPRWVKRLMLGMPELLHRCLRACASWSIIAPHHQVAKLGNFPLWQFCSEQIVQAQVCHAKLLDCDQYHAPPPLHNPAFFDPLANLDCGLSARFSDRILNLLNYVLKYILYQHPTKFGKGRIFNRHTPLRLVAICSKFW